MYREEKKKGKKSRGQSWDLQISSTRVPRVTLLLTSMSCIRVTSDTVTSTRGVVESAALQGERDRRGRATEQWRHFSLRAVSPCS